MPDSNAPHVPSEVTLATGDGDASAVVAGLPRSHCAFGRYVLLEHIGHGGMGVVWAAYDPLLDRKVALKLLLVPGGSAPGSTPFGHIVREAQAMARVQHPNVVTVYDAGIESKGHGELAYVAMELVAGRTLKEWLADPERIYGPETPDCAAMHNNIANVLRDMGRYDDARQRLDRAIAIWTQAWGPDSPAISVALASRGRIEMAQHRPAAAEGYFRRSLEIRRKKRPAGHPEILNALADLGEALTAQGKREAIPLLEEAVVGVGHHPDADARARAEVRFLLGRARVELGADRAGGVALAAAACKELDAPASRESFADCQAWLAKRAGRGGR